ncbi:MAG: N-acetylmuramoyl-L-alanine amidase [Lachnospiraceae bacterium]|nr:N-acetylmuramoyl-L-alanine amidase [Lachnospiraceae bacterium]
MEKIIKRGSALAMGVLTLAVILTAVWLAEARGSQEYEKPDVSGLSLMDYYNAQAESDEEMPEHHMRIELPEGMAQEHIKIKSDALSQTIVITIPDIGMDYFSSHSLLGSSDHIDNLILGSEKEAGVIEITTDEVYEVQSEVKDGWLYLDFVPPRELYEKVLVIDAGHGGGQPGAIKMGVQEKDLNLAILLELKSFLDRHPNWKVYYTRTEDEDISLDKRVQLANKTHANLFISIHSNATQDGTMSDYNGTEVMYDEKKPLDGLSSKNLAQICLEETLAVSGSRDLGLTRGNSIYIIRTSQVPVALVEVGFMTNEAELAKLNTAEYQKILAQGIYNGIVRALEEGF